MLGTPGKTSLKNCRGSLLRIHTISWLRVIVPLALAECFSEDRRTGRRLSKICGTIFYYKILLGSLSRYLEDFELSKVPRWFTAWFLHLECSRKYSTIQLLGLLLCNHTKLHRIGWWIKCTRKATCNENVTQYHDSLQTLDYGKLTLGLMFVSRVEKSVALSLRLVSPVY